MPLPFIVAAGAWIAGAIGTAATTVAAAGAAIAGAAAAAGTAIASVGAMTILGVSVAKIAAGAAVLFVGYEIGSSDADEQYTHGKNRGYVDASKEYEKKLNAQAKEFLEKIAKFEKDKNALQGQRDELAKMCFNLLGAYEGLQKKFNEQGKNLEDETVGLADHIRQIKEEINIS